MHSESKTFIVPGDVGLTLKISFWKIAIPVMVVTILIFMWNDLERMGLFLQKKLLRRRIKQASVLCQEKRDELTRISCASRITNFNDFSPSFMTVFRFPRIICTLWIRD